jgi:hypothetical protein
MDKARPGRLDLLGATLGVAALVAAALAITALTPSDHAAATAVTTRSEASNRLQLFDEEVNHNQVLL